jgi:hypothetical protein
MDKQKRYESTTPTEKIFAAEIEKRLTSDLWDQRIAGRVRQRRQSQRRKRGLILSLSSAASVAAVLWLNVTGPLQRDDGYSYAQFVDRQVMGTYDMVFTGSRPGKEAAQIPNNANKQENQDSPSAKTYGVILSSPTDEVISSALYVR